MAYPQALFLSLQRGRRFCVLYESARPALRALLFVPPLAEEMNKSRRMAALQARALAEHGYTVLQMDLFGCGDSDGEFAEAHWQQWVSDIIEARAWLAERSGCLPSLWGLRAGCLLACQAAQTMEPAPDLLFWQPATSGKQALHQFLRLRVAAALMGGASAARISTQQLREQLAQGETIEVAGYSLSPGVALGLEAAQLTPPAIAARLAWLEVGAEAGADLSPAASAHIRTWQDAGHHVTARAVGGPAFWQSQDIVECPDLVLATLAAVADWRA